MSPPVADSTKDVEKTEKKLAQRRINKPLIEKRRRARINDCLAQLKTIVLEASDSTQTPRPSKLEKADILEMTVDFIKRRVPTTQYKKERVGKEKDMSTTVTIDSLDEFTAGYSKCLQEISVFLEKTQNINESTKQDVVSHISKKLGNQKQQSIVAERQTTASEKIPITLTKKRTFEVTSHKEQEVMDLSVNAEQVTNQKQPLDLSKTGELHTQDPTGSSAISNQNPQMPFGLLCGGQIMLLVQVPTSFTSQQHFTQSLTSQNSSLSSTLINNRIQSIPSLIIPPSYTTYIPTNKDSEGNTSNKSDSDFNTADATDRDPAFPEITAGSQNAPDIPGHWRPW